MDYLDHPPYIQNPQAWAPTENATLLAILTPPEIQTIQDLSHYQTLLEARLRWMVQAYEPNQSQTWQEMVRERCSKLGNHEVFLPATMEDEELIQALAQSPLIAAKLGEVTSFPQNVLLDPDDEGERNLNSGERNTRRVADSTNSLTPENTMSSEPDQSTTTLTQVPYQPKSSGKQLDSYVPQNLEAPIQKALNNLEAQVGNVDEFVADR